MVAQHPIFLLPESFDAESMLPRSLARYGDDARYVASTIVRKTARWQADSRGYVPLRAQYLREVMSFRHARSVVQALLDAGAVHRTSYQVGKRPFAYRLDDRYRDDRHVRVPVKNARLLRRLTRFAAIAKQRARERMLPVHRALASRQHGLEVDGTLAREIIAGLPLKSNPFDIQGVLVRDIEERRFRCSIGRYGRVANNITSMKREVRAALRCGGDSLAGVDVSCCQPGLLALLLESLTHHKRGKNVTSYNACVGLSPLSCLSRCLPSLLEVVPCLSPSCERFRDVCRAGELFDVLGGCLRDVGLARAEIKRKFLADVLAKRKASARGAEYPSVVEDAFRDSFPEVWQFIRAVNRNGWEHWRLIRVLQRLESWLVIEQVCPHFMRRHPHEFVITLHDAVFVRPATVELLVEAFHDVFDQLDFHLSLKLE